MSEKSSGTILGSARLGDAANSAPGRAIKGAGSFLFGPSIFLAGVICGAVGKIAAESTNALLSSWVKSVSSGVSTLFANNPFLTWASSASGDLMGKSADSFFYFYQESLVTMGSHLEEVFNHDGFGNTGRADESNVDPRDAEARMSRTKDGSNAATEKRLKQDDAKAFFEMLKDFNQPENTNAAQEAIKAMEEWAKGAKALEAEVKEKTNAEQVAAMQQFANDFEKATKENPALGALTTILDHAAKMAVMKVREDLNNDTPVEPAEFAEAYKKLYAAIPDTVVENPTGKEVRGARPRVPTAA